MATNRRKVKWRVLSLLGSSTRRTKWIILGINGAFSELNGSCLFDSRGQPMFEKYC